MRYIAMSGEKEQFVLDYLLNKIESGSYRIGERIPSEYQLARKFNIDKGTANRAVSQLVTRGYLKRTRGAGGTIRRYRIALARLCKYGHVQKLSGTRREVPGTCSRIH